MPLIPSLHSSPTVPTASTQSRLNPGAANTSRWKMPDASLVVAAVHRAEGQLATPGVRWSVTTLEALRHIMEAVHVTPSAPELRQLTPPTHVNLDAFCRIQTALLGGGLSALEALVRPARVGQKGLLASAVAVYRALPAQAHEAFNVRHPHLSALGDYMAHLTAGRDPRLGLRTPEAGWYYRNAIQPLLAAFTAEGYVGLTKTATLIPAGQGNELNGAIISLWQRAATTAPPSLIRGPDGASQVTLPPAGGSTPQAALASPAQVPPRAATPLMAPSAVPMLPVSVEVTAAGSATQGQQSDATSESVAGTCNGFSLTADLAVWSLVLAGEAPAGEEHREHTASIEGVAVHARADMLVALTSALSNNPATRVVSTNQSFAGELNGAHVATSMATVCALLLPRTEGGDPDGGALTVAVQGITIEASLNMLRGLLGLPNSFMACRFLGQVAGHAFDGELGVLREMLAPQLPTANHDAPLIPITLDQHTLTAPLQAWWRALNEQRTR